MPETGKTMFEVYRETSHSGEFRIVYFTELDEHNKATEIDRVMAGQHFVDGFLKNHSKVDAKRAIEEMLDQLNRGEALTPAQFLAGLGDYLA